MHRICGDHRPGQVDAVQQRREQGDSFVLVWDIDLPQDHAAGVDPAGQQMPPRLAGHDHFSGP